MSLITNE